MEIVAQIARGAADARRCATRAWLDLVASLRPDRVIGRAVVAVVVLVCCAPGRRSVHARRRQPMCAARATRPPRNGRRGSALRLAEDKAPLVVGAAVGGRAQLQVEARPAGAAARNSAWWSCSRNSAQFGVILDGSSIPPQTIAFKLTPLYALRVVPSYADRGLVQPAVRARPAS